MYAGDFFKTQIDGLLLKKPEIAVQRITVEKEVFHQDILRAMNDAGLLENLSFMGGTCLRLCYGSSRLSEDLDFAADHAFSQDEAESVGEAVRTFIERKYGFSVNVRKPMKDTDTDTWVISILTHPESPNLPRQHIHIDICHHPAQRKELHRVINPYGFEGNPLFIYTESIQEILCDKIIAFAMRKRIKNRDIWDIYTLANRNVEFDKVLLETKIKGRNLDYELFKEKVSERLNGFKSNGLPADFKAELSRFVLSSEFESSPLAGSKASEVIVSIIEDFLC